LKRLAPIALIAVVALASLPDMARAQATAVTILPSQTAGVISEDPGDGTPPSGSTYLPFGNYIGSISGLPIYSRSYLLFPLNAIPAGVMVTSARLEVDIDLFSFPGSGTFGAFNVTATWDESMVWLTRAPSDATPATSTLIPSTPGTYTWDVTDLVNAWLGGAPNNGVMLAAIPPIDSGPISGQGFAARGLGRTSGSPPRLVVDWGAGARGGTIRGTVFRDDDQDGIYDAGESGLPGIPVHVESNGGWTVDLVTGDDGTYGPSALGRASYTVSIDAPPGYAATTPTRRESIAVSGNAVTGQDFGLASAPVVLPEAGAQPASGLYVSAVGVACVLGGVCLRRRRSRGVL
jgi:hypothetical protein